MDEIFSNFPELFIMGKYVKIWFKNKGSSCYFLNSRGQEIKNITNIEQKKLSLFTFMVSFFMVLLVQKFIYTTNIWFNFVFVAFYEKYHLLNLIILRVYVKRWLNVYVFQNRNWCRSKSEGWCFFNFDCQRAFPLEGL